MAHRKKSVLFVTGTRAEWGLFASTIADLKKSSGISLKVLVTGMHTQRQFGYTLDEVKKAIRVDCVVPVKDADDQLTALSKEIDGIGRYLKKNPVDAVVVVGDRDEPFAAASAAIHLGIPVIHVSGGDVSGPTVDQYLRNAITLFSDLHLVQTEKSKKNVLKLGANPHNTFVVGTPGLNKLKASALASRKVLAKNYHLDSAKRWLLVSMHPTVLDDAPITTQITSVLSALKKFHKEDEIILLYPNADEGSSKFITAIEKLKSTSGFSLHTHLPRADYLALMKESAALIGNTSSGLMEAGYLKVPFVHVGNRQQDRECGPNVIFVDYDAGAIAKGIQKATSPAFSKGIAHRPSPYKGGDVSRKIVSRIEIFLTTL